MQLLDFKEKKFENIISSMVDYMNISFDENYDEDENFDCEYTQADIDKCGKILDDYINALISLGENPDANKIMDCVKTVVLALNELNEDTNIIETDQREFLCPFIQDAAVVAGLPNIQNTTVIINGYKTKDDITQEWREW